MNRRHFLMSTAVMAGGAAVRGLASPNDTVRIGVVGCGGRGGSHVAAWPSLPNVEIVALCDVDEAHIAEKLKTLESKGLKKPATYVDLRKLLEDKIDRRDLDRLAESLAHAADDLGVPGRQGRLRREAVLAQRLRIAADCRRRPQVRPHRPARQPEPVVTRAARGGREAARAASSARSTWPAGSATSGATPSARRRYQPCRPGVDYDLWTGPAPKREFTKNRFHYNWHWFWDTGNGDLGNQGIHEVDIARWGLGVTHPTKVSAIGGKFMFDDDQETPNTISASYEFDVDGKKKMMTFEVRHWISPHEAGINGDKPGNTIGNQFYGSKGYLVIDNYDKYYSFLGKDQTAGTGGDARRTSTGPISSARCAAASGRSERRNRGRRAVLQPDAPGEHQLPRRPDASLGRGEDAVHRRRRSEQDADARLSGTVRGLEARLRGWGARSFGALLLSGAWRSRAVPFAALAQCLASAAGSGDSWWNRAIHFPLFLVQTVEAHTGLTSGLPWSVPFAVHLYE